jgi:hypothetical protein
VVFTLPQEIAELVRSNPSIYLNILFKSVRICLHQLMANSKYGGGIPAALCVLHTWGPGPYCTIHIFIASSREW